LEKSIGPINCVERHDLFENFGDTCLKAKDEYEAIKASDPWRPATKYSEEENTIGTTYSVYLQIENLQQNHIIIYINTN
jgi:hypothetical protein